MSVTPTADSSASQAMMPRAFPEPGTFGVAQRVTLLCDTPGARIHYTTDGSTPDAASPRFEPYDLPVLEAISENGKGQRTDYRIRAIALADGLAASEIATFDYTIDRRDSDTYLIEEVSPGIHMIRDFDDTKMYLVVGSERALLVDAGLGTGNLRALVEQVAAGRELDVVITHGHPDHIAAMGQFQDRYTVSMNHRDLPMVQRFVEHMGFRIDMEQIDDLHEGAVYELGDRTLRVYEVPGHSAGHTVLFDEANGILLASDAVGSNRPTITDSLWMQFPGMMPIDEYLSSLRVFRTKVAGKIKQIFGGHNDVPFLGETYLDNLQQAAQNLVDQGEAVLVPSLRPTDAWQVVVGDRLSDPNWAAINVAKGSCLSRPAEQIASLCLLETEGARLVPGFSPQQHAYTLEIDPAAEAVAITPVATSQRYAGMSVDGNAHTSGETYTLHPGKLPAQITVTVTSPDGSATEVYTLAL